MEKTLRKKIKRLTLRKCFKFQEREKEKGHIVLVHFKKNNI